MTMASKFDRFANFSPRELAGCDDADFKEIVNAEMRRADPKAGSFPEALVRLLRNPEVIHRWQGALASMVASVNSQMEAFDDDYATEVAARRRDLVRASGEDQARLEFEIEDLTVRHHRSRASRVRFRSAVMTRLAEVDALVQEFGRQRLVRAILDHRTSAQRSGAPGRDYDVALWLTLLEDQ